MREVQEEKEEEKEWKIEEGKEGEMQEKAEEEVEEDDSMEWELRNTDSVFSELSELSRDYVETVDQGASVRGEGTFIDLFSQVWLIHFPFMVTRGLIQGHKILTGQQLC